MVKLEKKIQKSEKHGKKCLTRRIVIPTVTRIVGLVAREV
jgi:hypothetical protein